MIKRITSFLAVMVLVSGSLLAQQTGKISGQLIDGGTGEGVPFAPVVVYQNGIQKKGTSTDFDGNYSISPLTPGTYDIKFTSLGYNVKMISGISVGPGKNTKVNGEIVETSSEIPEVVVVTHKTPLIGREGKIEGMGGEDIQKSGSRSINNIVALVGGTVNNDDGGTVSMKGARTRGTVTYVDGVKIIGTANLPPSAIDRLDVVTGGIPAQFGDVTGGIINLTTKGVSSLTYGGFEYETGRPFDQWNTDIAGFNISGPLMSKVALGEKGDTIKDGDGKPMRDTKMGYLIAAQYNGAKDPRPSAIGTYKVKDELFDELSENPLYRTANGYAFRTNNLTADDLEITKVRRNTASHSLALNGKVSYQISDDAVFTIGGNWNWNRNNRFVYGYSLLNYQNNPVRTNNDYNIYARLRQSFGDGGGSRDSSASVVSNAFYQVQVDFSKSKRIEEVEGLGRNFFAYGHIGNLSTTYINDKADKSNSFGIGDYSQVISMADMAAGPDPANTGSQYYDGARFYYDNSGGTSNVYEMVGDNPDISVDKLITSSTTAETAAGLYLMTDQTSDLVTFERSKTNELGTNILDHLFRLEDEIGRTIQHVDQISARGLYLNGSRAPMIGQLWFSTGRAYNGYTINDNTQIRLSALASAEINKKHTFTVGFEYEQRDRRDYQLNPLGLWGAAMGRVNEQFTNGDGSINYDYQGGEIASSVVGGETFYDYDYAINSARQSTFDKNLRESLGIGALDWIDVQGLDAADMDIGMFEAQSLWDNGFGLVDYTGYDYMGNRVKNNSAFEDFFTDSLNKPQASFNPIYTAFFIEDKFDIEDLVIRLGVRIDRYDANQRVLKDKYSITGLDLVGSTDLSAFANGDELTSGVIQDDWAIYVDKSAEDYDNNQGDYSVVGFRKGDVWYDKGGNAVRDPLVLYNSSSIFHPWFDANTSILDPFEKTLFDRSRLTFDAFEDYKPQWNFMPRLAFSFPISEEAAFYAHYDVLTQRPSDNAIRPGDFYNLSRGAFFINNSNLRPEKRTNFQLGFQQKVSDYSAVTLEAYYNEDRDQVAFTRVQAYPNTYNTFRNVDFGTTKGLVLGYDLRRKKNFRANLSYTLAFAEGTGSGSTTSLGLLNAGFGNLRVPFPYTRDQRHGIKVNFDYRFREVMGAKKEGKAQKQKWYSNFGANTVIQIGSGTPYSKFRTSQSALLPAAGQAQLDGQPNGSRLPWNWRATLRLDKDVKIRKADKEKGKDDKYVNVYVYIQNLFNRKNVLQVYGNTGQPDDDGYLRTDIAKGFTQSEIDLYEIALLNPSYISLPRRVRVGLTYSF